MEIKQCFDRLGILSHEKLKTIVTKIIDGYEPSPGNDGFFETIAIIVNHRYFNIPKFPAQQLLNTLFGGHFKLNQYYVCSNNVSKEVYNRAVSKFTFGMWWMFSSYKNQSVNMILGTYIEILDYMTTHALGNYKYEWFDPSDYQILRDNLAV